MNDGRIDQLEVRGGLLLPGKTISSNYTLLPEDNGATILFDSPNPIVITVSVGLVTGGHSFVCNFQHKGAGTVQFVGSSGITIANKNGFFYTNGQGSGNSIMSADGTYFTLGGDLSSTSL